MVAEKNKKLKIAFVLQGRFEAFELALALIERGHDVTVFTNYPAFALRRFRLNPKYTCRFVLHGILVRLSGWLQQHFHIAISEAFLCKLFGRWAAFCLRKKQWDVIFGMSGVSEEFLSDKLVCAKKKIVIRGSTHIKRQRELLEAEEARVKVHIDKPSPWMISREELEYDLADRVRVLSRFSYNSFLDCGIQQDKLWLNPPAFPLRQFQVMPSIIEQRRERVLSKAPLRVLYVGNLSFQKGMVDLKRIMDLSEGKTYEFRLVGSRLPETATLFKTCPQNVKLFGKKTRDKLASFYEWADLFLFPTIQDGFAMVLAEAYIAGLPILATENCAAPDFIEAETTGWVFPIRRPDLFDGKLRWCDQNREALALMLDEIARRVEQKKIRNWNDTAEEAEFFLEKACR